MNSIDLALSPLSEADHRAQLRRAVIASTVGTAIEWYDFLLYGQMTALVFGKLFFPKSDPLVGGLEAFAVYFVGFLARPIGAVIFGHFGDRVGRKGALIATLLTSGLACFAVGFVPTYASVGIWGAVLLTIIRFIQGVGVGGEWGGSVALSCETSSFCDCILLNNRVPWTITKLRAYDGAFGGHGWPCVDWLLPTKTKNPSKG